jgi:hypothetical protein
MAAAGEHVQQSIHFNSAFRVLPELEGIWASKLIRGTSLLPKLAQAGVISASKMYFLG